MKILFIQLPLVDHTYNYIYGNIQYAPSTLIAYIKNKINPDIEVEIMPVFLTNFGSDDILIKYINNISPDMVCFTNYLWNIERHLFIADKIKKEFDKDILTIFGGPEINEESIALKENRRSVDIFVKGEGEWFLKNYLFNDENKKVKKFSTTINNNLLISQPYDSYTPVDDIVEPFNSNYLDIMTDGSIFLELTRGCPYRCNYCFYSKNNFKIRELCFELLIKTLTDNLSSYLTEVYILSPTFNKTADFVDNLKRLKELNHGINLHTEMRAAGIDKETAELIREAGFVSLEVGLQTLNEKSLKTIGRYGDIEKELEGMVNLREAGIDLKIGIIPGLPEDTPEDFKNTIDRLIELGFEDSIEFYPLMLLPGTKIRGEVEKYDYTYQKEPPYYIIENNNFSLNDILSVQSYIEDETGFYNSKRVIPDFVNIHFGNLTNNIKFDGNMLENWNFEKYKNNIETNVFSFFISMNDNSNLPEGLKKLFPMDYNNNQLYNIIFKDTPFVDEKTIIDYLNQYDNNSFYKRLHLYDDWVYSNRIRFYHITDSFTDFIDYSDEYNLIEPVLKLTEENINDFKTLTGDEDYSILLSKGIIRDNLEFILSIYGEKLELISFEDKDDYYSFQDNI